LNQDYQISLQTALEKKAENAIFLEKVKNSERLDEEFKRQHDNAFTRIDCLDCANCCKTTSPILLQDDLDRLASHLKLSTGQFIQKFVEMDEAGDFVFNQTPCPFLASDNKCKVYSVRPEACSDYPHTNRKNMRDVLDIALENSLICPAVSEILDSMKKG